MKGRVDWGHVDAADVPVLCVPGASAARPGAAAMQAITIASPTGATTASTPIFRQSMSYLLPSFADIDLERRYRCHL
jgi:hypothetical protein